MAFADHYPLEAHRAVADVAWWRDRSAGGTSTATPEAREAARAADRADLERLRDHEARVLQPAIEAHLASLRDLGALGVATGLRGREIALASTWNDFVAGDAGPRRSWLWQALSTPLAGILARAGLARRAETRAGGGEGAHGAVTPPDEASVHAAWRQLCALMDAGDIDELAVAGALDVQDGTTGERGVMTFAGWTPVVMLKDGRGGLTPATDRGPVPLTVAEFDVPTGDLILTDYLRVGPDGWGFSRAVDFGPREHGEELSLGSAMGRRNRTLAHASEHGVAYAQTTNTCVVVHRQVGTGRILVSDGRGTSRGDDARWAGWERVGDFSCDVWRVMAMDVATAHALMARGGLADPAARLEAYLASDEPYADNVVRTRVAPGRWRLHAGEDLHERVDRRRFGIPKAARPWMLLEPAT